MKFKLHVCDMSFCCFVLIIALIRRKLFIAQITVPFFPIGEVGETYIGDCCFLIGDSSCCLIGDCCCCFLWIIVFVV
jgi:hypothetical protein